MEKPLPDSTTGDQSLDALCLDAATGKVLWEYRFNVFFTDIVSARVGLACLAGDPETGPYDIPNGLLLRGDIRALFERNLLRIHPRTRKIFLADELLATSYGRLAARQLRLPVKEEDRPSADALRQRWDASGKR